MDQIYKTYTSPFTWRYASEAMRRIWSEDHKRNLWRRIWMALAEEQASFGLINAEQLADLQAHVDQVDVHRAHEIEAEIHHDLMAELKCFAEQAQIGGGVLHLGATSMDIEDNAEVIRMREALDLVLEQLSQLMLLFCDQIKRWADQPIMGYTHLQPAEPSTLGYRLSLYAQDLLLDYENLRRQRLQLRGKGFKGAVGTGASYAELLGGAEQLSGFEARLSSRLGLSFFPVASQVYPRQQDYWLISTLAGLGATLYKFAFDLRILQSPSIGEIAEPFGSSQVGSSAMPFKRNPIHAEKIDSLARILAGMPRLAWDNAAHSLLERTLDDSANRRVMLPEAFLVTDEMLQVSIRLVRDLRVDTGAITRNLARYGPFAGTERVLMALAKAGADRQKMHEQLRQHSLMAWQAIQAGQPNPLEDLIATDTTFINYLTASELRKLIQVSDYVGDAPSRARQLVAAIQDAVNGMD